jgi:Flp pilus assembly protein TadD
VFIIAVILVAAIQLHSRHRRLSALLSQWSTKHSSERPYFVGANACADCHQAEANLWKGSHHQLAMQPATDATVLGDFNNTSFTNGKVKSIFFKRLGKFLVRTDGPDDKLHDYQIAYTFGVSPLQQYLIAMPGGRLQAFGVAWDSRPHESGGHRWVFLYPGQDTSVTNPLHWTGRDQTWNYMCADCHSTNIRKNYNLQARSYNPTYAEVDVACEACHGPGSNHLAWAKKLSGWGKFNSTMGLTIALDERKNATWTINPATGNPRRTRPRTSEREIQMCARCHSRRGQIREDYVHGQAVGQDYRVALLDEDLYFPDGQIKGEVYEYGSFIQSRMFHDGVTCSDCHEPHRLTLLAVGNSVCLQCHSARYDSRAHHFHRQGSDAAQCVSCHMPTRTYMVIDARRDHSIRVPRPDLSVKLGAPNACNECHNDKSAQWAADAAHRWYGHAPSGLQQYAETLQIGVEGAPGAERKLEALIENRGQPAIARATALSLLAKLEPASKGAPNSLGATDASPLVRRAATHRLFGGNIADNTKTVDSLLRDPILSVRIEAAEILASLSAADLAADLSIDLDHATEEYITAQELDADRPEAHMNLALLFAREQKYDRAEAELKIALSLDPGFAPASVNLADLYRGLGRDTEGEAALSSALKRSPNDASLLHALGLLMVRKGQNAKALDLLGDAASLEPTNARYTYVYAIALNDNGRTAAAINVLEESIKMHPYDRDSLSALVASLEQDGDFRKALIYAQRLNELEPDNPDVRHMLETLNARRTS